MARSDYSRRKFIRDALAVGAVGAVALKDDALPRVLAAQSRLTNAGARPTSPSQASAKHASPGELMSEHEAALQAAGNEDYWREIQQAFSVDRSLINFNNGGVSPSPRIVQDAMRRHLEFSNNAMARNMWQIQDPEVETVRARLARMFGCSSEEMAVTRNASESLEICIYGMDLKAGDEVLTTDQDYPRMINTYKQRALRDGIVLNTVPVPAPVDDPAELLEVFAKNVTPKTKVILCSHIVNITGQIFPVRDIVNLGRKRGIPVIVDGAHAFGHFAFKRDDLDCDYYGVSLHKWLTAPVGTGLLYVRQDKIESLWPLMAAVEPRGKDIRKFEEIGTHPAANRLAISEAVAFYNGIGPHRKEARLRLLRDRWATRLMQDKRVKLYCRLEPRHSCGIGNFTIDGIDNAKLSEHLFNKHRIITTFIDHTTIKGIRVTPNVYTTLDEIDLFCEAVEHVLASGLPV